ncbi:hypothetical protein PG991_001706 [Apiospora marii]|uniref:Heterokaryon incompatibility domain-containing protein n=1 Tax=Apiospora marii TaxID=335849 RepID=A0ABR1SQF6_9PEZI
MKPSSNTSLAPPQLPVRPQSTPALPAPQANAGQEGPPPGMLAVEPPKDQRKLSWRKRSSQKLRQGWDSTQDVALDLSASATDTLSRAPLLGQDFRSKTTLLSKDLRDTKRGRVGEEQLCEHCSGFPISACWDETRPQVSHIVWETPLERIIRLSSWCPLCRLFLHMISRPQNDPLKSPEVAKHVPKDVVGFSMPQLLQKEWKFIDKNWPFGRTSKDGAASTYALEEMEGTIALKAAGPLAATTVVGLGVLFSKGPDIRDANELVKWGNEIEQEKQIRYRKKVSLQVTLCTSKSTQQPPGLLLIKCQGFTASPGSELADLSKFYMRVADSRIPLQLENEAKQMVYGHKLNPRWIDLSITKQWLWECETKHGTKCSEHGWEVIRKPPQYLRVIDVQRQCIVDGSPSCRYIALSYMWGGFIGQALTYANKEELMQEGGLAKHRARIPRTILDAMEVVAALGERYLWADTLCKLQENDDRAKKETEEMDRVYGGALLTLVAASGTNADAGLQGVQRISIAPDTPGVERHLEQNSTEFQGANIIAPLDHSQNVESTPWNRRGWTFQERLLSRRLLVFAHNEAIWYCREDMENGDYGDYGSGIHPLDFLTLKSSWLASSGAWMDGSLVKDRYSRTHLVRSGRLSEYIRAVEQYTPRQLTFQTDVLFAFAGLGSIFERSFESRLLFGLPESILDVALLWRPAEPLKRRFCTDKDGRPVHFPSWSWAGWEGAVRYDRPFVMQRDGDGNIKGYGRALPGEEGEEGIRPLVRWHTWDNELGRFEAINGQCGRGFPVPSEGIPREWRDNAFGGNRAPHSLVPDGFVDTTLLRPYHLMFATSSVTSFRLGPLMTMPFTTEAPGPDPLLPQCSILREGGDVVGNLTLDRVSTLPPDGYQKEFIVLAETHKMNPDGGVGEFKDYLVMLIAKSQHGEIYERLGLGNVDQQAFELAAPEIKTIILG